MPKKPGEASPEDEKPPESVSQRIERERAAMLAHLGAGQAFLAGQRFEPLVDALERDAALPAEQRTLMNDPAFMAAIEQMVLIGLLSPDAARLHTVADGSFARVYAIMITGRTVAIKTLRPQETPSPQPAPCADPDANLSDASVVISALAAEHYDQPQDCPVPSKPYRRGAMDGLAHEAAVLEGMPAYLPMMRLSRDRVPYLLMKHIDGCSLWRMITTLPPEHADRLASALARSAFEAQIASGHIQMDIKPANIVVSASGSATVVDWGLSRPIPPDGQQISTGEHAVGTPGYMAPEQMRGLLDVRSPVYQLGCVLFEVWTRKNLMTELLQMVGVQSVVLTDMFQVVHRPDHRARLNTLLEREFPAESGTAWRAEVLRAMLEHDPRNRTSLQAVADFLALHEDGEREGIRETVRILLTPAVVSPVMPDDDEDDSQADVGTEVIEIEEGE